jgi:iron-sulfur cluster assembly accessory protein
MELPPFRVTGTAIAQIETVGVVRIDLVDGGCCGTAYDVGTGPAQDGDCSFGCEGARLVVSAAAVAVLSGATLDYGSRLKPPRYRVLANPHTPERCPCNRSFGQPWPGRGQPDCRAKLPMPWD